MKVSAMTRICQGYKKKDLRTDCIDDANVLVLSDSDVGGDKIGKRGGGGSRRATSKSRVTRKAKRERAERLLEANLDYIHHSSFEEADADREILQSPENARGQSCRKPPQDADFYLAHLYEVPLLTREDEAFLFRKMNYLKFCADRLRKTLDPERATVRQLNKIEQLQRAALDTRNQIVEANLRLVFSLAKRYATAGTPAFDEFISEGHLTVMRAVEKFDFSRGVKFSTYATWSVLNGFNAMLKKQGNVQRRLVSDQTEGIADSVADHRVTLSEEQSLRELRCAVGELLENLNGRERKIIEARFGFDADKPPTLRELGETMGVSKERVRQLQERAIHKLQSVADQDAIDFCI
jgi:RNA polymerase sigma factor (sigma-70 family)